MMSAEQDDKSLNASQNEDKDKEDDTIESENGEDVLDENEFEKNYETNKEDIDALLTVFDSHSHLMKVLIAIELWGYILDGKCAIQKICSINSVCIARNESYQRVTIAATQSQKIKPERH